MLLGAVKQLLLYCTLVLAVMIPECDACKEL